MFDSIVLYSNDINRAKIKIHLDSIKDILTSALNFLAYVNKHGRYSNKTIDIKRHIWSYCNFHRGKIKLSDLCG